MEKVSAVIPAFNEEKRIHNVLRVLKDVSLINEIIVVNDGSTDHTHHIASEYTNKVISLEKNIGKAGAIIRGIEASNGDIIILLDADLIGLTSEHVLDLLFPVLKDEVDTTIGIFTSGRFFTDWAQKIAPFLSGQRVIKKELAADIYSLEITEYGFEVAITRLIMRKKLRIKKVILNNMSHVMKEEKLGLIKGLISRARMYWQIIRTFSLEARR